MTKNKSIPKKKLTTSKKNKKNETGKQSLEVIMEETEELSIEENKDKSRRRSKVCYCSPTTHKGSFRCRLHRKKSPTDKKKSTIDDKEQSKDESCKRDNEV